MYRYSIKDKSDVPDEYLFNPKLQTLEMKIQNRVKGRDRVELWDIYHHLALLTRLEGHCPYKDYLKDLVCRKL